MNTLNRQQITPLFLFSLPRSGSTLVQRILGAHNQISTVSEPWILISLLYSLKADGVYAEYGHRTLVKAIHDFYSAMPDGKNGYLKALRQFLLSLFTQVADSNSKYFLEKTPRNSLVIKEIFDLFPDGKFIFLWRNPLAVLSSITEGLCQGKWRLYDFKIDVFKGLSNLIDAYQNNRANVIAIRYEDLLTNTEDTVDKVLKYLELPADNYDYKDFSSVRLEGIMGDPTGQVSYRQVTRAPLDKWKGSFTSPLRKMWYKHFLNWLGKERLQIMGYDFSQLQKELDRAPMGFSTVSSDLLRFMFGAANCVFEIRILGNKLRKIRMLQKIYGHR